MTRSDELNLIKKILSGESDCFEFFVIENQNAVYSLALKMTRNEQDALDISQDAFIKAYTNLNSFRGESKFSVWLYRLTYNLCLDFLRKKQRTNVTSITYENVNGENEDFEIADITYSPEQQLDKKLLSEELSNIVDLLPDEQKQIFIMREYYGMSYDDIADTLSINLGTVKSRLSRARQKIVHQFLKSGTYAKKFRHKDRKEENYD